MSARPLPVSTPAEQGVDASGITAFLDAVESAPDIEPHSLMILRHGHLVASGWWAPYTPERLQLLYSLSKSFTSTAAGLAAAEGLLDLDEPVLSYFPEFDADITDPRSRALLVRHVAAMSSGHLVDTWGDAVLLDPKETVRGFLLIPPDREPGTVFAYNQSATYALASIVQKVTGQSLTGWLRTRLFDPLGIGETAWTRNRAGREIGFSGMHAATDAVARLGQLYLGQGVWEGRRILPASWISEATRAHVSTADGSPEGARSDWQQGYGLQFWRSRHGYRGDGAYGQFCVVLPEHDAVIATTAATEQLQELLNLMWRHLLPAFGTAPLRPRTTAEPTRPWGGASPGSLSHRSPRPPNRPDGPTCGRTRPSPRRADTATRFRPSRGCSWPTATKAGASRWWRATRGSTCGWEPAGPSTRGRRPRRSAAAGPTRTP